MRQQKAAVFAILLYTFRDTLGNYSELVSKTNYIENFLDKNFIASITKASTHLS